MSAFLSKWLPMFAYVCSYYPIKSCPVFADVRMSFAFLALFTHGFSLFLIHRATRASQPWHVGSDDSLFWGCPVPCRMVGGISVHARRVPPPQVVFPITECLHTLPNDP